MIVNFRRPDGSFVVEYGGLPYHVPVGHPWHAEALELGANAPLEPPLPPALTSEQLRAGMSLSDIQFAIICERSGLITASEAEEWVSVGALPAVAVTALNALPENQRTEARIRFRGARTINRTDPFIAVLRSVLSLTDEQVDDLFIAGAAL